MDYLHLQNAATHSTLLYLAMYLFAPIQGHLRLCRQIFKRCVSTVHPPVRVHTPMRPKIRNLDSGSKRPFWKDPNDWFGLQMLELLFSLARILPIWIPHSTWAR
jgi:hypothetical protein